MPLSPIQRRAMLILMLGAMAFLSTAQVLAKSLEGGRRIDPPAQTIEVPLRFKRHSFQAFCYNAIGCQVTYNNHRFLPLSGEADPYNYVSPPPPSTDYREEWLGRSHIGILNFPGPAQVSWKSLDGKAHQATIDLSSIFEDELVWHKVSKKDMANFFSGPYPGSPDIFLEVNDRTINIYMTMFIPTKTEQIAGNRYSSFRNDIFLTWTRSY